MEAGNHSADKRRTKGVLADDAVDENGIEQIVRFL
jgi:hypothetical protein